MKWNNTFVSKEKNQMKKLLMFQAFKPSRVM